MNVHQKTVDAAAAQQNLDLAVIGNGRTAALVNPLARIVWWCFPRFDGDPVFCRLLAGDEEKGFTDVVLDGLVVVALGICAQHRGRDHDPDRPRGGAVRITDFAPRFEQFGRTFRPPQLMRMIEPIAGLPRITIRFRPTSGHGQRDMARAFGSNHIRYTGDDLAIRLTTDAPLSYIDRESPFVLTRPVSLVFGADTPFEGELATTCREFCRPHARLLAGMDPPPGDLLRVAGRGDPRRDHAQALGLRGDRRDHRGAHHLDPRSAGLGPQLGLSLLLAARRLFRRAARSTASARRARWKTTSPTSSRIVAGHDRRAAAGLQHRVDRSARGADRRRPARAIAATGRCASAMPRWRRTSTTPMAASILAATPMFFDRRLPRMGDETLFRRLEPLGEKACELAFVPDAGIWEYRERKRIHTHSVAMCWAGCQRLEAIAAHLGLHDRAAYWGERADRIHADDAGEGVESEARARSRRRSARTISMPACCCCPNSARSRRPIRASSRTVDAIERELKRDLHVMRYSGADDFGLPETAFLICRFWLIDALWAIGRKEDARDMFVDALKLRNSYGLLSEDVHPVTGELWGNFPQTYSMAGLILSAMRLSQELGGPVLARLVVVSNRVAVPDGKVGGRAGGLEVAVKAALRNRQGVWFGWSGKIARKGEPTETTTVRHDNIDYVVTSLGAEDYKEYYNGFANRVLWPVLHYRLDLAEFSRRDLSGYMRVNEHFATELDKILRPDDVIWVHDYHLIPLAKMLRARGHQQPHRLFPAHPVSAAGGADRAAEPRAADPDARRLRSGRLPDRRRRVQLLALSDARVRAAQPRLLLRDRRPRGAGRRVSGRHRDRAFRQDWRGAR